MTRSTIQQALDTVPELRDGIEKQQAFVAQQWAAPLQCSSCSRTHSVADCAPRGWRDQPDFPTDLVCPNTLKPVEHVVTHVGACWISERVAPEVRP